MPPQRTPLGPRGANSTRGPNLTPYQRGKIAGAREAGDPPSEINIRQKVHLSTIRYTLKLDKLRVEGKDLTRTARRKSYTNIDERHILRFVRKDPKATYAEVKLATGVACSARTIKRILVDHGITNWRAKRRPLLTELHAAKRLAWCLAYRGWTKEEWGLIMWSDECSVERGRGKAQQWVFRTPAQKWDKDYVQTYKSSRDISIMVWGCFWDFGRSDLYILDRDFESKKQGYSANSYLAVLNDQVSPYYADLEDPGYIFMQDNARIHTAHKVRDWFTEHGITTLDWPPYSPDLNPIEHVWWLLKKMLIEQYPELSAGTGKAEKDIQAMQEALKDCWDQLPGETFDALFESMPDRVEACIKADRWHTKY